MTLRAHKGASKVRFTPPYAVLRNPAHNYVQKPRGIG
jgi:hypothetical protein